jgi:hypothetical protein
MKLHPEAVHDPDGECACHEIKLNGRPTGARNLSEHCPVHCVKEAEAAERMGSHW